MCFIIPPAIFNSLAVNGDEEQKSFATEALATIQAFLYNPEKALAEHLARIYEAEQEDVDRKIYDAQNKMTLPGKLIRSEGEKSNGDRTAEEAYDFSGDTHQFYQKVFGRNSIDNKGMSLLSTVHYGKNFSNAFWDGKSMTYGDGDGQIFRKFTIRTVVSHEITHGITERSAGLVYRAMPGALNESFSDIFGVLVEQYAKQQKAEEASWKIGEGLFTDKVKGDCLRNLRFPGTAYNDSRIGKDPQPDHMDRYVETDADQQGVHINSSIQNKAFCITALNLGGYAWEQAGRIFFDTLTKKLKPKSQFQDSANATMQVATELYGKNSRESKAVKDGWKSVGITVK